MEQRDFFISYTKTDQAWAVWIADVLKRNGYSVYAQALDIRPGDDFLEKMEEFLENSRNFIAVWSKGYSKSRYCMNELRAAFHEWNDGRINCLLPVRVDNHPMKALYAALVHVELSDRGAASEATLANAVRRAVPRPYTDTVRNVAPRTTVTVTNTPEPEEDAETLFQRGKEYYYGRNGVKQDYAKARDYFEQAAAKGHSTALNNLGSLCGNAHGVTRDYAKARDYYEQAVAKGNFHALYSLGILYEKGNGVTQDYAKARNYYEQAAAKGHVGAMFKLGQLYYGGLGVPQDYVKAREYYEQAAAEDNKEALYSLGYLYYWAQGVQRDYDKARKYFKQAAAKGHTNALYALGWIYEYGEGVEADYNKALDYYQKAADAGHKEAPERVRLLRHEKVWKLGEKPDS